MVTRGLTLANVMACFSAAVYAIRAFAFRIRTPQRLRRWSTHVSAHNEKRMIQKGLPVFSAAIPTCNGQSDYSNVLRLRQIIDDSGFLPS